jgi:DNA repair protein RadD
VGGGTTTMQLRDYQQDLDHDINRAWEQGARNVLAVSPTGSGKTQLFASKLSRHQGEACAIAHRQELVGQISLALNAWGVRHKIIAPTNVVRWIINEQILTHGHSLYEPNALVGVAGVDTLLRRTKNLRTWMNQVSFWVQDEAHHVLRNNKWGKAVELFPNAKGLGVTATPIRADGRGLGRHVDGVMDELVEGPTMRDLIDRGYLTDYRIFAPPSDLDLSDVTVSDATGDYNRQKLKKAAQRSHLIGDVVENYKKFAYGKLGVTFATDVETATQIAKQFNDNGIPAEVVSAKTPDSVRSEILRRFRRKELWQLVNVDLFGEGFDLPAIEVVSFARPTQSYALYVQQFGRALRILEGKDRAIIIDHAGNVVRHGLPDKERVWSLEGRESSPRAKDPDDEIPLRYCVECTQPYERTYKACPYCGHYPIPDERSAPEFVDGDLLELSPEVLAALRGEVERIDEPAELLRDRMQYAGAPIPVWKGAMNRHRERQEMQSALRESISWWAGYQQSKGRNDSESYRLFYHVFGVDVMTAQALGKPDALALANKINNYLGSVR